VQVERDAALASDLYSRANEFGDLGNLTFQGLNFQCEVARLEPATLEVLEGAQRDRGAMGQFFLAVGGLGSPVGDGGTERRRAGSLPLQFCRVVSRRNPGPCAQDRLR
jgi:hypothetical protein